MAVCTDAPKKIRVSWSKLKTHSACRQRGKLLSAGHKSPVTNGRNFLPGTLADNAMRYWLDEGAFEPGGMEKFLPYLWDKHTGTEAEYNIKWRGDPREDKKAVLSDVRDALRVLEPILMEKVAPYAYRPEYRFTSVVGIPGPTGETVYIELFGAVDVAVKFDEYKYGLFDLKITKGGPYLRKTLGQLVFYDLAFRGHTGFNPVEHAFWAPLMPLQDPPSSAVITTVVTDEERMQMISQINSYCQDVWAGQFQLTEDKQECWNCPVKHACPRFVQPITKDKQGKHRAAFERPEFETLPKPTITEKEEVDDHGGVAEPEEEGSVPTTGV